MFHDDYLHFTAEMLDLNVLGVKQKGKKTGPSSLLTASSSWDLLNWHDWRNMNSKNVFKVVSKHALCLSSGFSLWFSILRVNRSKCPPPISTPPVEDLLLTGQWLLSWIRDQKECYRVSQQMSLQMRMKTTHVGKENNYCRTPRVSNPWVKDTVWGEWTPARRLRYGPPGGCYKKTAVFRFLHKLRHK